MTFLRMLLRGQDVPAESIIAVHKPLDEVEDEDDTDDPARSIPLTRYNAMLAVVKNTLFM